MRCLIITSDMTFRIDMFVDILDNYIKWYVQSRIKRSLRAMNPIVYFCNAKRALKRAHPFSLTGYYLFLHQYHYSNRLFLLHKYGVSLLHANSRKQSLPVYHTCHLYDDPRFRQSAFLY